ncbi:hypothetical protein F5X96DRAFT_268654 [Biscogniauxia mediterranea]|nr:hypothetical protein F5X96DRAFT_268654 [Biscogniauxia mediterranea]
MLSICAALASCLKVEGLVSIVTEMLLVFGCLARETLARFSESVSFENFGNGIHHESANRILSWCITREGSAFGARSYTDPGATTVLAGGDETADNPRLDGELIFFPNLFSFFPPSYPFPFACALRCLSIRRDHRTRFKVYSYYST